MRPRAPFEPQQRSDGHPWRAPSTTTSSSSAQALAGCGRRGWLPCPAPRSGSPRNIEVGGDLRRPRLRAEEIHGLCQRVLVGLQGRRRELQAGRTATPSSTGTPSCAPRTSRSRPALSASTSPAWCRTPAPTSPTHGPSCRTRTQFPLSDRDRALSAEKGAGRRGNGGRGRRCPTTFLGIEHRHHPREEAFQLPQRCPSACWPLVVGGGYIAVEFKPASSTAWASRRP